MKYADPESLDYDQEIIDELDSLGKDLLIRFFNHFADDLDTHKLADDTHVSAEDIRKIIAADLVEQTIQFLDRYQRLKDDNVQLGPATQYLAERFDIPPEKLEFTSLYDLLITLYEYDLADQVNEIAAGIDIRQNAWKRAFILEQSLNFTDFERRIDNFYEMWHGKKELIPIRVICENKGEETATLQIHREKQTGSNTVPTFGFRKEDTKSQYETENYPIKPEVDEVEIYELKSIRLHLETTDDESRFIFTEAIAGWDRTLNDFFEAVFNIDTFTSKIQQRTSGGVESLESDFESSIKSDEDPLETAREKIQHRRDEAKKEVEKKGLPPAKTQEVKDCIETIEIGGSDIEDDPSIATNTFRLVGDLPELFKSVDIETGFKDMVATADPDKRNFVIRVKNKAVGLENGRWKKLEAGSLGDNERQSLEIFFQEDQDISI